VLQHLVDAFGRFYILEQPAQRRTLPGTEQARSQLSNQVRGKRAGIGSFECLVRRRVPQVRRDVAVMQGRLVRRLMIVQVVRAFVRQRVAVGAAMRMGRTVHVTWHLWLRE
jgi:hypothetical protein